MRELEIKDLHVSADSKEILKGINYKFETGKTYAIIGPNGNGKSTLLSAVMGDPNFEITKGNIILDGEDITEAEVDEKANKGIYLGMQYPSEIEGVSNLSLIKSAIDKKGEGNTSQLSIYTKALKLSKKLRIEEETISRDVNVGFSGGEKKKNEILQMFMINPSFAFLDEIDSGLDVDSIQAVSELIEENKKDRAYIIVSHYKKLFEIVKPDRALIIKDGKISKEGDYNLLMDTLNRGFDD